MEFVIGAVCLLLVIVFLEFMFRPWDRRNTQQEVYRLQGIASSQTKSLTHWRKVYDATQLEARVREWVESRLGKSHMHRKERAMRLLEESIELAQAEGISAYAVQDLASHVYRRPPGDPVTEAANVAVCLYGWCAAAGCSLTDIAAKELERLEGSPGEKIRASFERKLEAGLFTKEAMQGEEIGR